MEVPKLRFKEFTDQWQTKTLGEVFEILSGTTPPRAILGYFGGEFNWVKTTDLNNSLISDTQEKVTDLALNETSLRVLPKGTVLIAMYGGFNQIGRTGLLTRNAAINQALSALLPKFELVHPYFLLNYLNYRVDDWKSFAASSRKDPNITKNDVKNFTFIFPALNEQTKIASFLTAIDERITQLTQKCDLLAQYKKGVMQQIFSQKLRFKDNDGREFPEWEEKYFGEVFSFVSTNSLSRELLSFENGNIKNIHYGDIHTKYKSCFKIEEERVPYIKNTVDLSKTPLEHYCKVGDLVIADASEDYNDIGKTIEIISLNSERLLAGLHTYIARDALNKMALGFSGYLMQTAYVRLQIKTLATGVSVLGISKTSLTKIKIKIPSKAEQTKIANFLTAIDDKITQAQTQLEAVKRYKKGLLQQLFV